MATAATNEILNEWETSLKNYKANRNNHSCLLPTSLQLYKLGLFLHELPAGSERTNVQRTYREFVSCLPYSYRESLFSNLWKALESALEDNEGDHALAGLQCMAQLCEWSALASDSTRFWSMEIVNLLASRYNKSSMGPCILSCLKALLMSAADFEQLLPSLHILQQETTLWTDLSLYLDSQIRQWRDQILLKYPEDSQKEYLASILSSNVQSDEQRISSELKAAMLTPSSADKVVHERKTTTKPAKLNPEHEIKRRIKEVQSVLPDLGEGFVEAALSCFNGNVELTVSRLLDGTSLPGGLSVMDRSLPRRHDKSVVTEQEEVEARAIAKATVQAAVRQEEEEAALVNQVMRSEAHDEYNDDYDDQYDDMNDGGLGGADAGLYDNFDAIRTYNRVAKEAGAEQSFWEENRNTNQAGKAGKKNEQAKQFRGPDKTRGGRIPGRGRGRGGGRGDGRGRGGGNASEAAAKKEDTTEAKDKPNLKQKARKLDKRRNQQKKAQVNRTG